MSPFWLIFTLPHQSHGFSSWILISWLVSQSVFLLEHPLAMDQNEFWWKVKKIYILCIHFMASIAERKMSTDKDWTAQIVYWVTSPQEVQAIYFWAIFRLGVCGRVLIHSADSNSFLFIVFFMLNGLRLYRARDRFVITWRSRYFGSVLTATVLFTDLFTLSMWLNLICYSVDLLLLLL